MTPRKKKDGRGGPRPGSGRPRNADGKIHRTGVTIAVYFPLAVAARIRAAAVASEKSVSAWITEIISAHLDRE